MSEDDIKKNQKSKKKDDKKRSGRRWVITSICITFVISSALQLIQSGMLTRVNLIMAFFILMIFVLIGILFDIIGVSVTSAEETPLHALSSRKVRGAKEAVRLLRNADKVGSFCNDVIGDIVGIISGSMTSVIVMMLLKTNLFPSELGLSVVLTALVAALTIGGKAAGKRFAIEQSSKIVLFAGKIISFVYPVKKNKKK